MDPLTAVFVATAAVVVTAGVSVWNLFLRPRPQGLTGFAAVNEQAQEMWDPLMRVALVVSVLMIPVLYVVWRRVLADHAAVTAAFESRAQLAALSPEQFERWCANQLRAAGYVVKNVGGQGDHGVDLVATKDAVTTVVQCKRYAGARQVGEPQLRDLFGAMHAHGAARAMVVTAGEYTQQARAWSDGKPIDLWGVENLAKFGPIAPALPSEPLTCPRCGSKLVERENRATRDRFYGCSSYPRCRFTRPFA